MSEVVGVLALQGAFQKHADMMERLGAEAVLVRMPEQLDSCSRLIIPGGESTTLTKLIAAYNFHDALVKFGKSRPVMGTCAGLILMSNYVDDSRVNPLSLLNYSADRNSYGRQIDSFITEILLEGEPFRSVFIRAPRILSVGEGVEVLMELEGEPVLVKQGHHMALSFHPELTEDTRIHGMFLGL